MLIKYQNIVFKLPKFPDLDYLSEEKKNEFIYVLIHNLYQSMTKKDNYIDVIDYGKLPISKKEALLKKTYDNIFYNIGDFQSVLTSKKETRIVSNTEYIEHV